VDEVKSSHSRLVQGNWSTHLSAYLAPRETKEIKETQAAQARLVTISASQGYFVGKDERVGDEYRQGRLPQQASTITPEFQHCEYSKWQYSLDDRPYRCCPLVKTV